MRVQARQGPDGARRAAAVGDVVVLIDALRSSVTITAALAAGARAVIPVRTVEEARAALGRPGVLVAGERGGRKVPELDYGNSPSRIWHDAARMRDRVLMLTTSNGTPLVSLAVAGCSGLLAGSLPNADVTAAAAFRLAREAGRDITLLAAGGSAGPAAEDDYAAAWLAGRLAALGAETDVPPPCGPAQAVFHSGENGRQLAELGYADDVDLCARLNVFDVVGVYNGEGFVPWIAG